MSVLHSRAEYRRGEVHGSWMELVLAELAAPEPAAYDMMLLLLWRTSEAA